MDEFRDRVAVVTGGRQRHRPCPRRAVRRRRDAARAGRRGGGGARRSPWPTSKPRVPRVDRASTPTWRWRPTSTGFATGRSRPFGAVHVVCNNAGVGGRWDHRRAARAVGLGARGEPLRGGARRAHLPAAPARAGRGSHREHRLVGGARRRRRARHLLHVEVRRRRAQRVVAPRPRRRAAATWACRCCVPGSCRRRSVRSDRNAPASLRALGRLAATPKACGTWPRHLAAAGIPPSIVADAVFDAVARAALLRRAARARRRCATTRARLQWMEGGDPPALDASRAVQP